MKNLSSLFLSAVVFLLIAGCSRLTETNLEKVQDGMTTDEVKAILGDPTSSETGGALGLSGTTFTYHTAASDVKITFVNDKVIAKEGSFQ